MIRSLTSAFLFVCSLTFTMGQDNEPIILVASTGQVIYKSNPDARPLTIVPGALVQADGMLILNSKSRATLQYKGHLKQVTNTTIALNELFDPASTKRSLTSFDPKFAKAVEDAFIMAYLSSETNASPWGKLKNMKGMGDGWGITGGTRDTTGSASKGTGDGFGITGGTRDTTGGASKGTGDGWGIAGGTRDTTAGASKDTGDGWGITGGTRDTTAGASKGTGDGWGIAGGTRDTTAGASKGTGDGWGITGGTRDTTAGASKDTGDGFGIVGGTRDTTGGASKDTGDGFGIIGGTRDTTGGASKGTGDGWGGTGTRISPLQPYGNLAVGDVVFEWSRPAGALIYVVEIMDKSGKVVQKGSTSDTMLILPLSSIAFTEGETYTWKVRTRAGDQTIHSNDLKFRIMPASEREKVLEKVKNSTIYDQSDESVRHLMHAVALEEKEWFSDAIGYYTKAQKLGNKKAMTARLMHSAFWSRQGVPARAVSTFNSK